MTFHNVLVALKRSQNLNNGQPSALASWIAALNLAEGDSRSFRSSAPEFQLYTCYRR